MYKFTLKPSKTSTATLIEPGGTEILSFYQEFFCQIFEETKISDNTKRLFLKTQEKVKCTGQMKLQRKF